MKKYEKLEELEKLVKEITDLKKKQWDLHKEISKFKDGFNYKVDTQVYGSSTVYQFNNWFSAKEHMDEYYGDNGIVILTTNNYEFAKQVESHPGMNGHDIILSF